VTPAELVGQKFTDVTPVSVRALDVKNANMVMEGKISSYLMPKSYEFQSGKKVDIILMVVGVYSEKNEFLFFVSRILEQTIPQKPRQSTLLSGALSALKELAKRQWIQVLGMVMAWAMGALAVYFASKLLPQL
jgi:hypothetical protein